MKRSQFLKSLGAAVAPRVASIGWIRPTFGLRLPQRSNCVLIPSETQARFHWI